METPSLFALILQGVDTERYRFTKETICNDVGNGTDLNLGMKWGWDRVKFGNEVENGSERTWVLK